MRIAIIGAGAISGFLANRLAAARALFHEGVAVAAAHGFTDLADPARVFQPELHPRHQPSIRRDLDLGRPMGIDTILRIVQDFGR